MGNVQGGKLDSTTPEGVRAMDEQLQKKFSKGIQYNMKVVIRGDRNTGKTCLFYRMQGKAFSSVYIPTNEIQVTHIHYAYPGTNDKAKIEIWDVVDKGKVQRKGKSVLKMFNDPSPQDASQQPLDAEFLNVYQGAHGVVMLFDITKQWTWQYIEREIPKVPLHIPVLVMGNFMDIGMHRVVSKDDAIFTLQHLDRPEGAADVRYSEASLKNSFGLRYLHKFLSVPFLQMQQEVLLQQLKVNREQILMNQEELDNNTLDYDDFIAEGNRIAEERKKKEIEAQEQAAMAAAVHQLPKQTNTRQKTPSSAPSPKQEDTDDAVHNGFSPQAHQASHSGAEVPLGKKLSSKFSGFWSSKEKEKSDKPPTAELPTRKMKPPVVGNVDEFIPEGDIDDQFFDDGGGGVADQGNENSDSDKDFNPLVAADEDLSTPEEEEDEQSQHEEDKGEEESPEEEDSPEEEEMATPINLANAVVPSKITPRLRNARDVQLTDSEEEGPVVMGDEDIFDNATPTAKKSSLHTSGGLLLSGGKQDSSAIKKAKPSGALLTEHHLTASSKKPANSQMLPSPESSSAREKHSHKERKARKGSSVDEDDGSIPKASSKKTKRSKEKKDSLQQTQAVPVPAQTSDPFGLGSLDAWLEGKESPVISRSTHSFTIKSLSESMENEQEDEEAKEASRKHKKHRRHKEDGEKHNRKKHKSRKRQSEEGGDDYSHI